MKAIAIYRDNCKVAQPLSGKADKSAGRRSRRPAASRSPRRGAGGSRTTAPRSAASSASASTRGTSTSASSTTARPGDIFVDIAKEGTTLAGLMNSFMISVSLGLQYGVPLEVYVSKFAHMRFEPCGLTNDPDIRAAKSIVDYVFRWMGKKFLSVDQQEEIGILSPEVRARLSAAYAAARPRSPASRRRRPRPDGALQHARGRDRVLPLRRPDGPGRHVLHVPRLRDVHRLRLSRAGTNVEGPPARGPCYQPTPSLVRGEVDNRDCQADKGPP